MLRLLGRNRNVENKRLTATEVMPIGRPFRKFQHELSDAAAAGQVRLGCVGRGMRNAFVDLGNAFILSDEDHV